AFQPMESLHVINQTAKLVGKDLIAVSPNGTIEWTRHFTDDVAVQDNSHVEAHGGRVYLYHDYNETVLDSSGNLLFTIENISNPPSLDEDGNIYAVRAAKETRTWLSTFVDGVYYDYRTPSNLIEAFAPDGTLKWTKELDRKVAYTYFFPVMWNGKIGIPLYVDGRLYVPQDNGTTALSKDGSVTWKKDFGEEYGLFYLMPTDTKGDIYLYRRNNDGGQNILVVRPDGTTLPAADLGQAILVSASEGLLFEDNKPFSEWYKNTTPDNLETGEVAAMDLLSGKYIWNFTTPLGQPTTVIVNKSNIVTLFPDYWAMGRVPGGIQHGNSSLQIVPAENMTYVYFRTSSHEDPVVYGQSSCTYYSALYAIDRSGKLVWQKPMDLFVTAAAANNTTIYYGTSGGGISVATIGAVAGVAIVGSLLAFFLFGSVTRARSKIDKNDNRNRINKFIADRPGSTLYEISKELGMNIGTLRYHLMILGLNHRIVTYNDEGKFVRYFTNSNTYSDDDKMVISLLRRESMGRLLKAVLDSGEITNSELCVKLGLPESGISKYLSELSDKGVVTKTGQGTRMYFSIREIHRDRLSKALAMVDNTGAIVKAEEVSSDQVGA
ncbi:MAG TPA: winged helix-turn-helix transcriptional regulator, partial [Methanocella sp.]|uniref:winged helix-turn-helix transcriptional regulator n=1 Tax=Methanocella sp. TaxID=2052833 RepID=UPI002BA41424